MWAEFFSPRNWGCFCLYHNNRLSHQQTETTARFSLLNWSETGPPRCYWLQVGDAVQGDEETLGGIFTCGILGRFCLQLHNQRSYGKMDGTGRFSASDWSKTNPPRCSNCRLVMLYKGMKKCERNFLASDFENVLASLAATSRAMDKWT